MGFAGFIALLLAGYWSERRVQPPEDAGITTEAAAVITFFPGVLVVKEARALAIAMEEQWWLEASSDQSAGKS